MTEAPAKPVPTAAVDVDKLADAIRGRVDLFGKALTAIATLGTGAVGLTKVSDLARWDDGEGMFVAAAVMCLLAAAAAAIYVATRLMAVSQPVVLEPSVDIAQLGSAAEDVTTIFAESAQRYGFTSLLALREQATSLRRAAARAATADLQARRAARAAEAEAEIERALARARLAVVRRGATDAVTGRGAWTCYLVVIVGLMGFALAADAVTSEPAAGIATAKSCADARSAGALPTELPTPCAEPPSKSPTGESSAPAASPGPAQQRAKLVAALSALLTTCEDIAATSPSASATTNPLEPTDCAAIAAAMGVLLGAG